MDSESGIITEMAAFVPFINEEFLISIANKGIYKRAVKDLEKLAGEVSFSLDETDGLLADVDGVRVHLERNIPKSVCSCPATGICKHVVMALLALLAYYEAHAGTEKEKGAEAKTASGEEAAEEAYQELLQFTAEEAQALLGKREYKAICASILLKNEAVFQDGELLCAAIQSQGAKVYFPKKHSITDMMCSCKEKGMCRHKAYALISYLMREGKIPLDEETDCVEIGEMEAAFLNQVKDYIAGLLDTGNAGLGESEMKNADNFYRKAYGLKFFLMAQEWKSLSSELALYFAKNVSFSNKRLLHLCCRIYNRAQALLCAQGNAKRRAALQGQKREEKFNLDLIHLTGLGAVCQKSRRGDLIVSGYFYCEETKAILSMSTVRPTENNRITPEFLYSSGILFSDELSFLQVSAAKLSLRDAKLSNGRLSGSKSSLAGILGKTQEEDILPVCEADFSNIWEALRKRAFRYFAPFSETDSIFYLKVAMLRDIAFDQVNQSLRFIVCDAAGVEIHFSIAYNEITKTGIQYLENRKTVQVFDYILARVHEKNERLEGTLLSGMKDGAITNIYFSK